MHGESGALQIDRLMCVRVQPQRRFDCATPIAWRRAAQLLRSATDQIGQPHGEQHADLIDADAACTRRGCLRELAQHHDLRERR